MAVPWAVFPWPSGYAESEAPASLDEFLAHFPPSRTRASQVPWIAVDNPNRDPEQLALAADEEGLQASWARLGERALLTSMQVSQQHLDRLAREHGVLSGKWMVFCRRDQVDAVWESIARATFSGEFQDAISAKVSPAKPSTGNAYHDQHVICVYVEDYTDQDSVERLRLALRQARVPGKLTFKPDAFTYCGIYANNPWGIPPCLHYDG